MTPPTLAYVSQDVNTADIYLTDLPRSALDPSGSLRGVSGVLVHIHLFITPKAGETPIATGACSATVRCVVLADGHAGVYSGGGFLVTSGDPGSTHLGGSIRDATCRLSTRAPEFVDRLGASSFTARFRAPQDPDLSARLQRRLTALMSTLPPSAASDEPHAGAAGGRSRGAGE